MKNVLWILFLSLIWTGFFIALGVLSGWLTVSFSAPWFIAPAAFLYRHLRLSVVPFGMLFVCYIYLLGRMHRCLRHKNTELSQLTYYDRLLNTVISTFFGVGVIWTAVGMETALMHALDSVNPSGVGADGLSAWTILDRLVNGGLLLALSTTVFGGFCGYLLRLVKIILVGREWDRFVIREARDNEPVPSA